MKKTKVFFTTPTLFGGGAERVMSYVPQFIDKEKFDVTLIVVGFEKDATYEVSGIPVLYLNKTRVSKSVFAFLKYFRKEKPDIVLSTIADLNVLMGFISIFFPKTKFIGRQTIVSHKRNAASSAKTSLSNKFISKIYKFGVNLLDIILCQSLDMFNDMQTNSYKVPKNKLRVIHNPMRIDFSLKSNNPKKNDEKINFITVARLVPIKGYERILKAISKLKFNFKYTIVGDGREKNNIFKLAKKLGLENKINHVPYTSDVSKYLTESDYYLMGSFAEGFPNCLMESCSVGTPVIAFNAPGGLNEIIEDGINGFLVNNEKEFIDKLSFSHEWNPEEIRQSVFRKFNRDKIIKDYENLFFEILK